MFDAHARHLAWCPFRWLTLWQWKAQFLALFPPPLQCGLFGFLLLGVFVVGPLLFGLPLRQLFVHLQAAPVQLYRKFSPARMKL